MAYKTIKWYRERAVFDDLQVVPAKEYEVLAKEFERSQVEIKRLRVALMKADPQSDEGCEYCGSMEVNPSCPKCQGHERDE